MDPPGYRGRLGVHLPVWPITTQGLPFQLPEQRLQSAESLSTTTIDETASRITIIWHAGFDLLCALSAMGLLPRQKNFNVEKILQ